MFLILYVYSYVTCLQVEITFFSQEPFFSTRKIKLQTSQAIGLEKCYWIYWERKVRVYILQYL